MQVTFVEGSQDSNGIVIGVSGASLAIHKFADAQVLTQTSLAYYRCQGLQQACEQDHHDTKAGPG